MPIGLNLAWGELYRWEGWPPHVVENYGRAGLRDTVALFAAAIWYPGAAMIVMPFVVFARRRTFILVVSAAFSAVALAQVVLTLMHWHGGGELWRAAGAQEGIALGLLLLIAGLLLSLVSSSIRRPLRTGR